MKENKRYLNCKYLDAGMDGMLCLKEGLCTTCKEFNGEQKCKDFISINSGKKKIIKSTNWLTKDLTKEEIEKIKKKAIREANAELRAKDIAEIHEKVKKQVHKEATETFYNKLLENLGTFKLENKSEDYKDGYAQAIADVCGKIDETAIELGVDLKRYYGK